MDNKMKKILFIAKQEKDIPKIVEQLKNKNIKNITVQKDDTNYVFYDYIERDVEPNKEKALLIDCVGNSGNHNILTAPSLLGLSIDAIPKNKQEDIIGDLFDLEYKIIKLSDVPESWIRNTQIVKLWSKENKFNLHNVNYFKYPDGKMSVNLPKGQSIVLDSVDKLGRIKGIPAQNVFDNVFKVLCKDYIEYRPLWDLNIIKSWGKYSATDKQKELIRRMKIDIDIERLSKGEASLILNRILN